MDKPQIQSNLQALGERVPQRSRLVLIGGCALALLGNPRLTINIDFIGDDVAPSKLHKTIMETARELKIWVEPVPLDRFIPLPAGHEQRKIRIGQFGNLEVFVADPYSIAISKLDRGFDTDLDDIVFLLQRELVRLDELETMTQIALSRAPEYDIDRVEMLAHLEAIRTRLK